MKHGWDKVFARKSLDKPVPIETHPHVCVICNTDTARFANAGSYAHHMTTHKFHRGYNPHLPPPSARKGHVLPKIKKKRKKKEKKFADSKKTLKFVSEKSSKRNKKKKSDYPRLIASCRYCKHRTPNAR